MFNLSEITIRVIDSAVKARELYGDKADYIANRVLPEHEYRLEISYSNADRKGQVCLPPGASVTAEQVLALVNR
jgi:hypothetical protein